MKILSIFFLLLPFSSSDIALRYDNFSGMFLIIIFLVYILSEFSSSVVPNPRMVKYHSSQQLSAL